MTVLGREDTELLVRLLSAIGLFVRPRPTPSSQTRARVHSSTHEEELMDQAVVQFQKAAARENRDRAAPSSAARITMGRARSVEPRSPPPATRSAKPPAWSASIRVHIFCVRSTRQSADLGRLRSLKTCSRQP